MIFSLGAFRRNEGRSDEWEEAGGVGKKKEGEFRMYYYYRVSGGLGSNSRDAQVALGCRPRVKHGLNGAKVVNKAVRFPRRRPFAKRRTD